jgi:WD40 repeat protein
MSRARRFALLVLWGAAVCTAASAACAQEEALAKHERWITSLAFSPDGSLLASAGGETLLYRNGDVKLWNPASGELAASLEGHPTVVWSVAFTLDGQKLVTSGYDGKIIVWSVAEKKALATLEKKGWIRDVAVSPEGKHVASAGEDGNVTIWNIEAEPKEERSFKAHDAAVYCLAFSPDGQTLATGSVDKTAKLWNWQDGSEKGKLEGHEDSVLSIAYSASGQIATCGADRKVRLWDAAGMSVAVMEGHKDWVNSVAFSPDGALLASASHDRTVRLWDAAAHAEKTVLDGFTSSVWSVAFSPDGKLLAAGSHKDSLRLWEVGGAEKFAPPKAEAAAEEPKEE